MLKSLIWKNKPETTIIKTSNYSEFEKDLKLKKILSIMSKEPNIKISIEVFLKSLTSDIININYRQCILKDLLKSSEIKDIIENLITYIDNMVQLHKILKPDLIVPKLMLRLQKLETYYEIMSGFEKIFNENELTSKDFLQIGSEIRKHNRELGLEALKEDIDEIKLITSKYKSLVLGVNLDHQFKIREAIILEIYSSNIKKSNILDKINAKDTNERMKLCVAPEIDIKNKGQIQYFKNTLYSEFEDLMGSDIKLIETIIDKYSSVVTSDILAYRDELCLYYGALRLRDFIVRNKQNFCFPEVSKNDIKIDSIYSINMMYEKNTKESQDKFKVVSNNIYTEKEESSILISGINNGGKTVLLRSLATAQLLFQNGIIVPAINAKLKLYQNIYTHFPKDEDISNGTGRLGEEASRIGEILNGETNNSLVLLNEPYVTTSPIEGLDILVLTIEKFLKYNISIYLVTHYLNILNELQKDNKLASYIMEIKNGKRTYKVERKHPLFKSYALDIAKEYAVDKDGIMNLILDRNIVVGD